MEPFFTATHLEGLDPESKYLMHKAKDAALHAYAPYSRFQVGAAVLLADGSVITGSNQENAAYPSSMCAERVALYAVAAHHPEAVIKKIAVVARRKGLKDLIPVTPCGSCRQVLVEFEARQSSTIEIVMQINDHKWVVSRSAEALLPFTFTKANLDHHEKK